MAVGGFADPRFITANREYNVMALHGVSSYCHYAMTVCKFRLGQRQNRIALVLMAVAADKQGVRLCACSDAGHVNFPCGCPLWSSVRKRAASGVFFPGPLPNHNGPPAESASVWGKLTQVSG